MSKNRGLLRRALLLGLALCPAVRSFAVTDFYWERPTIFVQERSRFPVSAFNGRLSVVAWQESVVVEGAAAPDSGQAGELSISVSLAVKRGGLVWKTHRSVLGPFVFTGTEPAILSITVDRRDRILLAVAVSPSQTDVFISADYGATFNRHPVGGGSATSLAPRIYTRADGGFLLLATRGLEQSLSIYYSLSDDGLAWTPFAPFITEEKLNLNFLPTHAAIGGKEVVVFQSLSGDIRPTFQLFVKTSADAGKTWTPARLITDFEEPYGNDAGGQVNYDNQRPYLAVAGDRLLLVWERRAGGGSPQVYIAELREDGSPTGDVDRVNQGGAYCNSPLVFDYRGEATVVWTDNRRGLNRVYLAQRRGIEWQEFDISGTGADVSFARPVADADGLFIFWQAPLRGTERLYLIEPDKSVAPPRLRSANFESGSPRRQDSARVAWQMPDDPSGIAGYAFSWSQDPQAAPPRRVMAYSATTQAERTATEDGTWYFSVIAQDYAGNWSPPARIEFVRDTTAPPAANIVLPPRDEKGYLDANTFTLNWNPPPASDIVGFTWSLDFIAPPERYEALNAADFARTVSAAAPVSTILPPRIMGTSPRVSFVNQDDGIWRFSVAVIDSVGNIGPPASVHFRTNKYIPYTFVTYIDPERDEQGSTTVAIFGRGFTVGGRVARIFLDRDGQAPYDREFTLEKDEYRLVSDRQISGLRFADLDEGRYRIGLVHPGRGTYLTGPLLQVDETGTVKFGDYNRQWEPSWSRIPARRFIFNSTVLILTALFAFGGLGMAVSIRGIGHVLTDSVAIRMEAVALITGDSMPSEKKKRLKSARRRSGGLLLKLSLFTIFLVIIVVALVSVPLSLMMTRTQEATLLQGLRDRSRVLLESLASGARAYLPSRNVLELGFLPAQTDAVPEARYATITGFGTEATVFSDHIWATNDADIQKKIDTAEFSTGVSRLQDVLTPKLGEIARQLDERAKTEVGSISRSIAELTQEGLKLALRTDAESSRRRDDIQNTTRTLEARLNERLTALAAEIGSEPLFDPQRLPGDAVDTYIFFKPVMYRQGTEDIYFRGLIRLEVSISSIRAQIAAGQRELLRVTTIVALAALAMGVVGALLLSTIIIIPIKKLAAHVEMIRDTGDKAQLEGKDILIKTRDEIAFLGNTINEMTHGLVKAAVAAQDLTIGKEVQKKFIPLEVDSGGNKLTTGFLKTDHADFFGYYEGAKGVSGDYFDYRKLDDRYFAIIKCDVAGKGIPAALIMIQVATMFISYFKDWKPTAKGLQIETVVYQINDFIEALGFAGRFAAFTLALFDSHTGLVRFCNAGDNIVHWYDASERAMKLLTLPMTPATGVLSNKTLADFGQSYTVQTLKLEADDILMLYTDGIEEAKRRFRDPNLKEIVCSEGGAPVDTPHGNHSVGQADEEMGYDRVEAIIRAALNRGRFTLSKYHNPIPDEKFDFDFSTCDGTVEDAIMALVSVEKIFRLYRDPAAGDDAQVLVDRKVDVFLGNHFAQYKNYCAHQKENPDHPEYLYYTHVREDDQYDDLTILGIRKK